MTEVLTYERFDTDPFKDIDIDDETKGAYQIIKWAYEHYGDSI
ncbi:phosphoadenosine phosphosulfate reductase, partial [Mammaliicoccus sciuri]|nr:phosphoadenosine phosphosulfate reductase [Mammaliicoccus sciuri]